MTETTMKWLLEDKNPAIKYRTKTELLGESADVEEVKTWVFGKLPAAWDETKGLWYSYYVTALAECGLSKDEVPKEKLERAFLLIQDFQYGCADFMLLRALVMLGYQKHEAVRNITEKYQKSARWLFFVQRMFEK